MEDGNQTLAGPGYACASDYYDSSIAYDGTDGYFPYRYRDCSDMHLVSGHCKEAEILQPNWLCLSLAEVDKYKVGNRVECKYYGNENADTYTYPQAGEDFIEVLYQEAVYIPMGDYIALWVCVSALCTALCRFSLCGGDLARLVVVRGNTEVQRLLPPLSVLQ